MVAAVHLGGAKQRLLPEHIPFRFFGTALVGHVLMWFALAATAPDLPWFAGGPGPVLAAVHILTLGVLVPTAMGASLQMLPVALGRPAPCPAACLAVFWLLLAGAALIVCGFAATAPSITVAGAVAAGTSVAVYAVTAARVLWGAQGSRPVALFVWTALASLAGGAGLAIALSLDYGRAFLSAHGQVAVAHAILSGYGFMGMLALGFSHVLVPMFAVAEPQDERLAEASFWPAAAGLALGVIGVVQDAPPIVAAGVVAGLIGSGLHIGLMARTVRARLRKRLGPEFALIMTSWAMLPASLLLAAALVAGMLPETGPALLVFVVLFGWLLTLLVGVLQRIIPFLASMHTARGGRPIAPSRFASDTPLAIHRWCHAAALIGVGAGIGFGAPKLILAAAAVGAAGAAALAWFAFTAFQRTRRHLRPATAVQKDDAR